MEMRSIKIEMEISYITILTNFRWETPDRNKERSDFSSITYSLASKHTIYWQKDSTPHYFRRGHETSRLPWTNERHGPPRVTDIQAPPTTKDRYLGREIWLNESHTRRTYHKPLRPQPPIINCPPFSIPVSEPTSSNMLWKPAHARLTKAKRSRFRAERI